ncbi:MAG: diguanylate cyclase [Arcobacter sp.]|uniref:diguanylate cyclase n=1 Tax=Arcobacter sp. TaxID=1872629 RepID=UPI003CFF4F73
MMPTIEEIAVKSILSIEITKPLKEAINKMASSNLRNIVVIENTPVNHKNFYLLTISDLINYKLDNIDEEILLRDLKLTKAKILKKDLNILNVLNEVETTDKYMVIVENDELIGILSYTDIINNIDPKILMKKQTIATLILQYKATTTYENTSTIQAIKMMKDNNSDSIIIIDDDHKPIGIFTTKDFINLIHKNSNLHKPINLYMSKPVYTLSENSTIAEAIDFIRDKHFKRIVVTNEEEEITGILTQKELLRIIYNKWIDFIKEEGNRISKMNEELLSKASMLEEKASFDFLTKLYNRRKFNTFLEYEISKANRYKEEYLSLLLVDIDYFKNVNDYYGHLVGDNILQEVSKILTICSRDTDIVARWGGEEFILMLPQTNVEQAFLVAQKLRATIEKHKFDEVKHITCSIGVTQFQKNEDKDTLFKRVDSALYKAKNAGRNRVEIG